MIHQGDALTVLRTLPAESVQCCVTSPPYWGLRDYGIGEAGIGLEATPEEYVARLVEVFREVRRVLRKDGTLWLNLGDSYTSGGRDYRDPGKSEINGGKRVAGLTEKGTRAQTPAGLKPKDLVGIPWRVAFALQQDGWYLRSDIIWAKPNPMPESVTDRPTKAHEYLFLLAKAERYYYDAEAIAEPVKAATVERYQYDFKDRYADVADAKGYRGPFGGKEGFRTNGKHAQTGEQAAGRRIVESVATARAGGRDHDNPFGPTRNKRTVWTIPTQPYPEAHFATFPEALVEPCILAGSRESDVVLDSFCGSGTTLAAAKRLGREGIGIELNPEYVAMAERRIARITHQPSILQVK